MLEIKLSKNMTITSDGKFNYILTKDGKPIGFYNSWSRLHCAMQNKKLTKKSLEKVNSISSLMSDSIKQINNTLTFMSSSCLNFLQVLFISLNEVSNVDDTSFIFSKSFLVNFLFPLFADS